MKRFDLLSTVLLVMLAACGSQTEPVEDTSSASTAATTPSTGVTTSAEAPVEVTGTLYTSVVEPYKEVSGPIVWGSGERGSVLRGQVYEGTFDMSDERISGEGASVINCDISEPRPGEEEEEEYVGECWGTQTVSNDGGTWEGTIEGTSSWTKSNPGHVHDLRLILFGSDGYEGLQFVGNATGVDPPWDVVGTIQPAD